MALNEMQLFRKLQDAVSQINTEVVKLYNGTITAAAALAIVKPIVNSLKIDLDAG